MDAPVVGPSGVRRERRRYNAWVNRDTLEDYALRYTASAARRYAPGRVAGTAIGSTAFLANEALGAAIALAFGFGNALLAIAAAAAIFMATGLPIARAGARHGVDIDLLTRGAGFGYLGSTVTSLVYATFTFLLFALEASILAAALSTATGLSLPLASLLSGLVVIPIVAYGMRAISGFHAVTQPLWLVLQLAPVLWLALHGPSLAAWKAWTGLGEETAPSLVGFGLSLSILLSLLPQIGEQVDYLRFLPPVERIGRRRWWAAMLAGGPGWALIAAMKQLLGALLALLLVGSGSPPSQATEPMAMYSHVFRALAGPELAVPLALLTVLVCQTKINVTNAYAGSIAWSNVFARLTHNHPGRVVWLVFNVALALLVMQLGILQAVGDVLALFAIVAAGWVGALTGDLALARPLGLAPRSLEFRRGHLHDLNPVGLGAMALAILLGAGARAGLGGALVQAFAPLLALGAAILLAPALAWVTRGRWYLAREEWRPAATGGGGANLVTCALCSGAYEEPDTLRCPFHGGSICSLCCTLEQRCADSCRPGARAGDQIRTWLATIMPAAVVARIDGLVARFLLLLCTILGLVAGLLALAGLLHPSAHDAFTTAFLLFAIPAGLLAWFAVLSHDGHRKAREDTAHHIDRLVEEIAAHGETLKALERAREAAEAANLAKSRYLMSLSHEARSPLNAVMGYAQLLEQRLEVEPVEAARVIRNGAEHLVNLFDGLLDISRIEGGVIRLAPQPFDLARLVAQVADMFRVQAEAKGLAFVFAVESPPPPLVRGDDRRLRQILINLLSNALKFTREGSVRFHVGWRGEIAIFRVIDTGPGVRPEDRERIFRPFERGSDPAVRRQQGTGLGLAISAALVTIMGGELAVEDTPGGGATFVLRLMLPMVVGAACQSRVAEPAPAAEARPLRILAVDDDPAQRRLLETVLAALGHEVTTASDVQSAKAHLGTPFDAALLDIQLPDGSGWEVAEALRAANGRRMRLIIVSGVHPESDPRAASGLADAFVTKPVAFDLLRALLSGAPEARNSVQGPRRPPAMGEDLAAHLESLDRLARMGHVRALADGIAELARRHPEAGLLAEQLRGHLDRFDMQAIRQALLAEQRA